MCEVWCRLDNACLSYACYAPVGNILLSTGGAKITSEYWPLDVFRPGILPNV